MKSAIRADGLNKLSQVWTVAGSLPIHIGGVVEV